MATALRASFVFALCFAVGSGCSSDGTGADTAPQCPGELQVKINEGLFFDECRILNTDTEPKVSLGTADMIVYKNKDGFDLWSGSADGVSLPLKKLTDNAGGQIAQVYKSLDEVPYRKPLPSSAEDAQGRFFNVATGNAAVVQNNVSKGWTKVWIKQAISSSELLIIQFETF